MGSYSTAEEVTSLPKTDGITVGDLVVLKVKTFTTGPPCGAVGVVREIFPSGSVDVEWAEWPGGGWATPSSKWAVGVAELRRASDAR